MKKVRKRELPEGWYPSSEKGIENFLAENGLSAEPGQTGLAGVVPHAGWFFSGSLMARVLLSLDPEMDVLVIAGGHLGGLDTPRGWFYEGVETPTGILPIAEDFLDSLASSVEITRDLQPDNTVEVVIPLIHYLFPEIRILGLRIPPVAETAGYLGQAIAEVARKTGLKTGVVGSTDLTHYGPNYRYTPEESRWDPRGWVEKRDRRIIEALCLTDISRAVDLAVREQSACSVGGAAAAASFAASCGRNKGRLLGYETSLSKHDSDSFVGYAGIVF